MFMAPWQAPGPRRTKSEYTISRRRPGSRECSSPVLLTSDNTITEGRRRACRKAAPWVTLPLRISSRHSGSYYGADSSQNDSDDMCPVALFPIAGLLTSTWLASRPLVCHVSHPCHVAQLSDADRSRCRRRQSAPLDLGSCIHRLPG